MSGVMESVTDDMKVFVADVVPLIEAKTDDKARSPSRSSTLGGAHRATTPARSCSRRSNARVYAAGTQMFLEPPEQSRRKGPAGTRPPRPRRGLTEDARWDEHGPKGPGVYARAKVFSPYRDAVAEMGPYIGLSHYVWGESKNRRGGGEGRVTSSPGLSPPARSIS